MRTRIVITEAKQADHWTNPRPWRNSSIFRHPLLTIFSLGRDSCLIFRWLLPLFSPHCDLSCYALFSRWMKRWEVCGEEEATNRNSLQPLGICRMSCRVCEERKRVIGTDYLFIYYCCCCVGGSSTSSSISSGRKEGKIAKQIDRDKDRVWHLNMNNNGNKTGQRSVVLSFHAKSEFFPPLPIGIKWQVEVQIVTSFLVVAALPN